MFGMFRSAGTVTLVVIIVMVSGSDARINSPRRPNHYCRHITSEVKKATDTLDRLSKITPTIIAEIQRATRDILAAIQSPYLRHKPPRRPKGKGKGKVGKYIDCAALYKKGIRKSGVYQIRPFLYGARPKKVVSVYCDMKRDGGGWTVFQRRFNGHMEFYRNWAAYKTGFGNAKGEYWLGNDIIHALTEHRPSELRVDLTDWAGKKAYAKYGVFSVAGSNLKYKLQVAKYSGTAGDSLGYHNGRAFSTYDKDNDKNGASCAKIRHGAWWYGSCNNSNLNGRYYYSGTTNVYGLYWYHWHKKRVSLMRSEIKVRPHSFKFG